MFTEYNPLGISLFGRNIRDRQQLKNLCSSIFETFERDDVLIAVDQEGGRVRRMADPEWRIYAPQSVLGDLEKLREDAEAATKYHAQLISADFQEIGINMNYAPVLDVSDKTTNPALKSRCFSNDESIVIKLGKAMTDAYIKAGICPCLKHLPGSGRATNDPHLFLPRLTYSLTELEKDFYPFKALNNAPAGMTAHIVIDAVDSEFPATQSKKTIDTVIRNLIGFDGLLISDALDMRSLKGSFGEKTKRSLEAGCDAVCYYTAEEKDIAEIFTNAMILSDKSYLRFEKILNIINNREKVENVAAIAGKYGDMVSNGLESYKEEYDATMVLTKMIEK